MDLPAEELLSAAELAEAAGKNVALVDEAMALKLIGPIRTCPPEALRHWLILHGHKPAETKPGNVDKIVRLAGIAVLPRRRNSIVGGPVPAHKSAPTVQPKPSPPAPAPPHGDPTPPMPAPGPARPRPQPRPRPKPGCLTPAQRSALTSSVVSLGALMFGFLFFVSGLLNFVSPTAHASLLVATTSLLAKVGITNAATVLALLQLSKAIELLGGLLFALSFVHLRFKHAGAALLLAFLVPVTLLAHPPSLTDTGFLKNIALAGVLLTAMDSNGGGRKWR